jgi:hypothetical protein
VNSFEKLNQPEKSLAELEQQLTQALRPVEPPEGFAERVMARAEKPMPVPARVLVMTHRARLWAGGAIAATLLVGVFTAEQIHERQRREQAELAQRQFEVALRITGEALEQTRRQLQDAGVPIDK